MQVDIEKLYLAFDNDSYQTEIVERMFYVSSEKILCCCLKAESSKLSLPHLNIQYSLVSSSQFAIRRLENQVFSHLY